MRRNYKGEILTSNLSRAAKARGYRKEMVRERQRSEEVLTDACHETAKCIPQVTIEPKRVQCRRGSAVGDTFHTSRPRTKEIVATFKKKDRRIEMFPVPVPFRNIGWFAIAPSTKGCGELLARASEDSKENYLCLTGGSILCSLGRTFTKINCRLERQLHVITVRNQEADFLQLVVLHEISKILYHQKA